VPWVTPKKRWNWSAGVRAGENGAVLNLQIQRTSKTVEWRYRRVIRGLLILTVSRMRTTSAAMTRLQYNQLQANTSPITSLPLLWQSRDPGTVRDRLKPHLKHDLTIKKRRHPLARAKDVVVGTRTLHTLSSSTGRSPVPAPGTTVAPPRIKKFLAKILALHGPEKRTSKLSLRWERRPSHLGLSKRTTGAPITAFARAQQRQVGTPSSHEHD